MKINLKKEIINRIWILNLIIGIASLLVIGLILIKPPGFQEVRLEASPASVLYFDTEEVTGSIGDSFTLGVMLNTNENIVPAVELHVKYDPSLFKATDFKSGSALNNVLLGPVFRDSSGEAIIIVSDIKKPIKRTGKIAEIEFEIIGQGGEGVISFSPETQASAWDAGETNVISETGETVVTISASN